MSQIFFYRWISLRFSQIFPRAIICDDLIQGTWEKKLDDKNCAKRMRNQARFYDNVDVVGDDRERQLWMRKSGTLDVAAHRHSDKQRCIEWGYTTTTLSSLAHSPICREYKFTTLANNCRALQDRRDDPSEQALSFPLSVLRSHDQTPSGLLLAVLSFELMRVNFITNYLHCIYCFRAMYSVPVQDVWRCK